MINMQGYLASSGTDANLVLGAPYEFTMDKNAYDSKVQAWYFSEDAKANKATFKSLGDVLMATDKDERLLASTRPTARRSPGVYVYRFVGEARRGRQGDGRRRDAAGLPGPAVQRGRPGRGEPGAGQHRRRHADLQGAAAHRVRRGRRVQEGPVDEASDLSENPWIYFVMLLVLIFEQAMAVRLSFHTRAAEVGAPVPWASRRWRSSMGPISQLVLQAQFAGRERHERPRHPGQESEFVFRRLTETFKVFGTEVDGRWWLLILGVVLLVGIAFVVWMYIKDSRTVRWYWAAPLALCASASTCSSPSCSSCRPSRATSGSRSGRA